MTDPRLREHGYTEAYRDRDDGLVLDARPIKTDLVNMIRPVVALFNTRMDILAEQSSILDGPAQAFIKRVAELREDFESGLTAALADFDAEAQKRIDEHWNER